MADTIIASLRAQLRLDATGIEDTITRLKAVDKAVAEARSAVASAGSKDFRQAAQNVDAAKNFVKIGESAKQAAVETLSLLERLEAIGASTETLAAVSQKFAQAMRVITSQSEIRDDKRPRPDMGNSYIELASSVGAAKKELAELVKLIDEYNKKSASAAKDVIKVPGAGAGDPQAQEAILIQREQMNLVRQAAREQEEADRKRQLAHVNNLKRLVDEAEAERRAIEQASEAAASKLRIEDASMRASEQNELRATQARKKFMEEEAAILETTAAANKRVAEQTAADNIRASDIEGMARVNAAKRAADAQKAVDQVRATGTKAAAAIEVDALRETANAQLIAAEATKRAAQIKAEASEVATKAAVAKKKLTAEVALAELEAAANAQKAAISAVADKQKEVAVTGASASANKELADVVKKLATSTEEYNKAMERLNKAKAEGVALENGVSEAIKKTNDELTSGLKALEAQEKERAKLKAENDKLRESLSQPVGQDNILAWLRNLASTSTLVSGPLSGLTSRLQALASLTNRNDLFTALQFGAFAGGITLMSRFSSEAIRVAKNLEPVENLLNLTRGANERAGKSFEDFAATAMKYGLSLEAIAKPFARLKIATQGTILEGERFKVLMEDMSAISATFALPQEQIAGMAKAVEQMLSKGTVQAEEFRQQLGDRLPAAARVGLLTFRQMTGNMTADMGDFLDAMEKRQIGSAQFLDLFFTKFKQVYGIDSTSAIDNVAAAQGRLSTSYDIAIRNVDKVIGATTTYKAGLNALATVLELVSNNASIASSVLLGAGFVTGVLIFRRLAVSVMAANAAVAAGGVALTGLSLWFSRARAAALLFTGALAVISGFLGLKSLGKFREEVKDTVSDVENAKKSLAEGVDSKGFTLFKIDPDSLTNARNLVSEVNRFKIKAQEAMKDGVKLKPTLDLEGAIDNQIRQVQGKLQALAPAVEKSFGTGVTKSLDSMKQALANMVSGTRGSKALKELINTKELEEGLKRGRDELRAVQDQVGQTTAATQKAQESVGLLTQAMSYLVPVLQGTLAIWLAWSTAIAALKWTTTLTGFQAAGNLADALTTKVGKLGKAFKIFGLVAAGVAAGLAFFKSEAKAAELGVDSLMERVTKFQNQFKTEGFIPVQGGQDALDDIRAKLEAARSTMATLREEYDKLVDVERGKGQGLDKITSIFSSSEAARKEMETLQITIDRLADAEANFGRMIDENNRLLNESGAQATKATQEGINAYNELVQSTEELRNRLDLLREGRLQEADAAALSAQEAARWGAAVTSSGQEASAVNAIIAERINLLREERQIAARQNVDRVYSEALGRAAAAKQGTLEAYDNMVQLNNSLRDFEEKARAAGYSGEELTTMMGNYKTSLEGIPERTARAGGGIRAMAEDIDYGIKKIKPVEVLQKALFSFADEFADLAVSGQLSAKTLTEAFSKMALDISKEILAMVIKINIILPLLKALQSSMGGGAGLGGLFQGMMGGSGGLLSGVNFFAKGGVVDEPTMFGSKGNNVNVMGEAGAEAILPLARGPGGVLGVQNFGSGAAERPVNITFNVQATDSQSFLKSETQIAAMLTRASSRGSRNM